MNTTLGPRNLGDILSETFTIYKRNFLRLIAIMSIVMVPFAVVLIISLSLLIPTYGEPWTEAPSPFMLLILIPIYFAFFAASVLMVGAVIHAAAQQYFNQPVSTGRAYSFAWRRLGDMFWALVLAWLAIGGIYLAAISISVIIAVAIGGTYSWLIGFGVAFLLIFLVAPAAIYLGTIWNFIGQTALLEGCGPTTALSRSAVLVKGSWWRVLGIVLLLLTIASIIGMIFYTPRIIVYMPKIIVAVNQATTGFIPYATTEPTSWTMIAASICALIGYIVYIPIFTIGHTLLYFDLRVRKQGYSLDALANDLGLITTSADTAASPTE